ncbi:hypothetical protein [Methylomarinum vadi]|nr:hypothetical protein [Methylomarinum vadi]
MAKRSSVPILDLVEISEDVSRSDNYQKRTHVTTNDEVGRL